MSKRLVLTKFGDFASRHSTATPPKFWTDAFKEITRLADEGADWEHMIAERLHGLQELRDRYYEFCSERNEPRATHAPPPPTYEGDAR